MTRLTTVGTDVEAFATDEQGNILALRPGMIEGKKAQPFVLDADYDIGIQLDNVLAEFTFMPSRSPSEFHDLCELTKISASKYLGERGMKPLFQSSHIFRPEELDFPHAKTAGCEPDFPAVEGDDPTVFDQSIFALLRSGSGHLHFGFDEPLEKSDVIQYVRGLDRAIGGPLCLMHSDPMRRRIYGQAGRFRFKPYGFEYRTPDNFWFDNSENMADDIWAVAHEMFSIPLSDPIWEEVNKDHTFLAQSINMGHIPEISALLDEFEFPSII